MMREPTNFDRAVWAEEVLRVFMQRTGVDRQDASADLIANVCHWLRREGMDPYREVERALNHFDIEEQEEPFEANPEGK